VLKHGYSHVSGNSGKPGKEIVDPGAAFKIFEQRFNRHSRAAKYPGAANPVRIARQQGKKTNPAWLKVAGFHPIGKFPAVPQLKRLPGNGGGIGRSERE
jgi:hypothetical protein